MVQKILPNHMSSIAQAVLRQVVAGVITGLVECAKVLQRPGYPTFSSSSSIVHRTATQADQYFSSGYHQIPLKSFMLAWAIDYLTRHNVELASVLI